MKKKSNQLYAGHMANLLGLEEFRVGRHILRDDKNWKTGEILVNSAWSCVVKPSFDAEALLFAVSMADSVILKAGFAIIQSEDLQDATVCEIQEAKLDLQSNKINLLPNSTQMSLDGISYSLEIETKESRLLLEFSTPTDPSLKALEESIIKSIKTIADSTNSEAVKNYHKVANKYFDR